MTNKTTWIVVKHFQSEYWAVDLIDENDSSTWMPNCQVAHPDENTEASAIAKALELNDT